MPLVPDRDGLARRPHGNPVRRALAFAGMMLACSLLARFAPRLGLFVDIATTKRFSMAMLGVFLVITGNALPKMLTPLSDLRCDPAKVQAFQRFSGWMWVLTGLAFSGIWLLSPLDVAYPLSMLVLLGGMLINAVRLVRLRRTGQRPA